MKRIGIGVSDFKHLIEEDFYYFDKTKFIDEIIKDGAQVKLFTRPRRFGKTLNMSMLKYFFDIKKADENRKLFKDLYIEKTESFKEQGQYPVIFLSLKDLKARTCEEMERKIIIPLSDFLSEYEYLLNELTGINFENLKNIVYKKASIDDLTTALKFLTKILYEKYNKKVVVLIDEYDSPLVSAYINGYYESAKDFFKTFYSSVLKDNNYLQMGVLTGIIRVIKAGIFSDLNNLSVYSILDEKYDEDFGLTEKEVEQALKDYNIFEELNDVKFWYDGYKMGNKEVYNPWSIINFLDVKKLVAFWIKTSGNKLIKEILKTSTIDVNESLTKLFNGEDVEETITGNSDLSSLLNYEDVWELLVFSGYLTIKEKIDRRNYILKIPNQEIREFFKDREEVPKKISEMMALYKYDDYSWNYKARNFYKQAKFMEDYEDDYQGEVGEISGYYTTYHDLNEKQLRAYFTWRSEIRKGIYNKACTSFIYIYIYELLCGIGASSTYDTINLTSQVFLYLFKPILI